MDEFQNLNPEENPQPAPPRRRRKRTKWQNFKEAYLPVIIAALALVLIIVFIVASVNRGKNPGKKPGETTVPPTLDSSAALQQEIDTLLSEAQVLATQYDYQAAMDKLSTFSAGINNSEALMAKYNEYSDTVSKLVAWNDINDVPNLSFRMLMADSDRALANEKYGSSFNDSYITTGEFKNILQQIYDNGFVLVSIKDLAPRAADANSTAAITKGSIYLPEGKKPLVMTELGVNYYTYIVDGDGDGLADKDGSGFASRLVLDANGSLTNEMVDAEGNTVTGSFDMVTILNDFVAEHPDFSYRGAKATLAVTGYDGLFGYRTDPETAEKISQEYYDQQLSDVKPVIEKLRSEGFDFACYSYDAVNYNAMAASEIAVDLEDWADEVTPLLGEVDIFVYPYDDIGTTDLYTGSKYQALADAGFRYFVSKDSSSRSWGQITDNYCRMMRREVGGELISNHPDWFEDLFDASTVLEFSRSAD